MLSVEAEYTKHTFSFSLSLSLITSFGLCVPPCGVWQIRNI